MTALLPNFVPSAALNPAMYELKSNPITITALVFLKSLIPVALLKLVIVKAAMQAKNRERSTALNASLKLTLLPVTIFVEILTVKRMRSMSAAKIAVVLSGAMTAKKISATTSRRISIGVSNGNWKDGLVFLHALCGADFFQINKCPAEYRSGYNVAAKHDDSSRFESRYEVDFFCVHYKV
ncbi:hypothetical protein [Ectopseudomonas khazarica]|uniref:hypothetical protein n=1 Tax=Ectopseudomonas khazarica TaxID=2502979 RepID=UPI003B95A947